MRNRHPAHPVRKSVSIQRLNRAAFEVLEDRRLLAATITGVKFDDVNADGQYDVGIDRALADQLIYVDLNNNGQFDAGTSTHASVLQPPASIPDEEPAGVEFMLDVPAGGTITDIDVTLDITHSWTSDLDVFLIAPDGTSIELFSSVGGGGENFTDTVLDDQAPTAITVGSAPFTGSFRPEGSLATFNGKEAMGTWKLHVIDREPGDTGVVNRWSLTINTGGEAEPSAVTDVDGTYTITLEDTSAGTYTVRDILPAYRTHSTPTGGAATVPVADGQTVTVNFGSYRPGFEGAGVLDTTFDTDGILTFPTLQFQHGGEALAVQADGGVIYGGWIVTETAGDREFFLARLNPDGTPDQSFNNGQGYVATDFINGDDEVRDIVIQDDGKIVAAGFAGGASGSFAFARYNADGSLDNSFDGDGKLIVDVTPNFGDVVTGLAVQTDGKIVAAGTTTSSSGSTDFATVRLNDNGSLDGTFAANGRAINDFLGGIDVPSDVIVDDDGNILVVGGAMPRTGGGGYLRWVLLRYTPTGQLDAAFDAGEGAVGKATHDFGVNALAKTVIQQGDGKYLVAGLIDDRWTLARFNNDGSIDTSFGNNGRTTVNDLIGNPAADFGMALQRDGKILLGGRHESDGGSTRSFAVARFLSDGSLDVDFGELDGFTITDIGDDSSASDLVLTSDDKILLVGGADSGSVTLVRYNNVVAAGPAFATLVNGVLTLTGTEQSDAFTITQSGTELTVQLGAESTKFNTAEVLGIAFDGLDGDDTLTLDMAGGNLSLASLTIVAGNGADKVALTNGDGKLMTLGSVPSLNGKTLDLGTADVVITNATVAAVEPLLRTARNDALVRWQGPGIGTSSATGDTGLAAAQQGADVLVKYTYNGDANGDGRINADDYFRIDSAFLEQPANPVYGQGDFNYDDTINADDYFLIDSAFLAQGAPLGAPTPLSASVSSATAAAANVESSFVVSETEQPKKVARRAPATDDGVLSRRTQRRAGAAARRGR
jgi:uncharacterized delta-60 repeat protein